MSAAAWQHVNKRNTLIEHVARMESDDGRSAPGSEADADRLGVDRRRERPAGSLLAAQERGVSQPHQVDACIRYQLLPVSRVGGPTGDDVRNQIRRWWCGAEPCL
jgi:hypothetical protein